MSDVLLSETLNLLQLSLSLFDHIKVENLAFPDNVQSPISKKKRKANVFSGNINDIDFPTSYNITKNSRDEIPIAGINLNFLLMILEDGKTESILSLLRKLRVAPKLSHHTGKFYE